MFIPDIKGLKFPDEYIIRFFFKENLYTKPGKVLELGCGNGNNLLLFYEYGWEVTGVDINPIGILNANENFNKIKFNCNLKNKCNFITKNMVKFIEQFEGQSFDVLLLPSSIYYLNLKKIKDLLILFLKKKVIKQNTLLFLRMRSIRDYRYKKGEKMSSKTFKLTINETGEKGSLMTFFRKTELINLLEKYFCFKYSYIFSSSFDNIQNGCRIYNSDIIFWGKINKLKK